MKNRVILNKFHSEWLILLIILVLGAYLRLHHISEYMTFLGDEGRDVLVVKRMIVDHKFTLLGPTASVGGFFLGPVYYYFMLPFLWAWKLDPTGPAVMVALFGIATIFLIFYSVKKIISPFAAIVASSLYALSPLVIAYSRSSWNPNVVPFFAILLFYSLWKFSITPRRLYLFGIGVILGIGIQLHYLFLFLYFVSAIWLLLVYFINRKVRLLDSVYGVLGLLLGGSLFLLFEIRHGFPNTQSIIKFLLTGKDTGFSLYLFFTNLLDIPVRLFSRLILRYPDSGMLSNLPKWQAVWWTNIVYIFSFVCIIGLFTWFSKNISGFLNNITNRKNSRENSLSPKQMGMMLLLIWFIFNIFFFGLYKRQIYDYYLGILYFTPFIIIAFLSDYLYKNKFAKWLVFVIISGLLIFNWYGRPFIYPPNNQLAQMRNIAKNALEKTDGKPFNFALIAGLNSDYAYRYFFEIWNRAPVTIENNVIDPNRKTVTGQLIVICEDPSCHPMGNSLWEIAGFGRAEIAGVWEVPFVKIFKLVPYKGAI
jgi:4-amino-4-deoxy-L-arabinose transferase-like glycosyltransferase